MNNFLLTKISYDLTYTIKDVLNEICNNIIVWINTVPELEHDYELKTFKDKFYKFMYQSYHKQVINNFKPYDEELYLYFSMKFSHDIIDLFIQSKEITRSYNLSLFHHNKDTSLPLHDFLFNHLLLEDPYNNDENEINSDEENNISYTIDE